MQVKGKKYQMEKNGKTSTIIKNIILVFATITFIAVLILNFIYNANTDKLSTVEIEYVKITNLIISIFIAITILIASHYLNKIKFSKIAKTAIIVTSIFIYVIVQIRWSNTTIGRPSGDQQIIYNMAKSYIEGNNENLYKSEYLAKNPQRRSLLVMYILIMKVVNSTDYVWLYLANILANVLSIFALYLILKKLSEKYSVNKALFAILTLTFIPMILLCNFIYGDIIGLAFILFSVYFIIEYAKKNKKIFGIISAILASIAMMFRMNYIIFVIAMVIYIILNFKKENIFKQIIHIIIFIAIILIPYKLVGAYVAEKLDLDKQATIPTSSYLYMSLYDGERGAGWYSQEAMKVAQTDVKNAKNYYPPILKERVKYLVTHPSEGFRFYKNKIVSMWTDNAFQCIFYNLPVHLDGMPKELYDSAINENEFYSNYFVEKGSKQIKIYMKGIVLLVFSLSLVNLLKYKKELSNEAILMITIFLGGFFFHVLWKAKSRYVIPYFVVLIPIACISLNKEISDFSIIKRIKNIFRKKEKVK